MLDEAVLRAMARWPDVPDVYGWMRLDRRGQWLIRDETIGNPGVRDFISRNYVADERGAFAFQNGPQRVYVALDYTPWIVTLDDTGRLIRHTGQPFGEVAAAWLDEAGNLLLESGGEIALLDDRDLDRVSEHFTSITGDAIDGDAVEAALAELLGGRDAALALRLGGTARAIGPIRSAAVADRFGFVRDPVAS